jgi:hypothetical protein
VGYAAPGTWPHAARDWRVVFPHTTPDSRLMNLYGRAVGTAEQVPKAKRHDHLPGAMGYFNAAAGPLWVCEGAFDALALLAAGVPRVVAIFGVQGWRWDWVREVRELVFALDADAAGQQQWRAFARQAALRGKRVAGLPAAAYKGWKDMSEAWRAVSLVPRHAAAHVLSGPVAACRLCPSRDGVCALLVGHPLSLIVVTAPSSLGGGLPISRLPGATRNALRGERFIHGPRHGDDTGLP